MEHLVEILERVRDEIPSADEVMAQVGTTDQRAWNVIAERLKNPAAASDVHWALADGDMGFTRSRIVDITHEDTTTTERRRLIAAFMWGYGTSELRYPKRIDQLVELLDGAGLDSRLIHTRAALVDGDVLTAYEAMMGISGVRSAYFTKHLYFAGKSVDPSGTYPLILDTQVARRLARLTGFSYLAITNHWPSDDPRTYVNFVKLMHELASRLDVSADSLERFLWRPSTTRGDGRFGDVCDEMYWRT